MTPDESRQLGFALNEASWVAIEVDEVGCRVGLTFNVLTLDRHGREPEDRRMLLVLSGVSRLAVWMGDVEQGTTEPLTLADLPAAVEALAGSDLYGWDYLDLGDEYYNSHFRSISLDWRNEPGQHSHTLDVWLMGPENSYRPQTRGLDARCWFGHVEILGPDMRRTSLAEFYAGADRWWQALSLSGRHTGEPNWAGLRLPDYLPEAVPNVNAG